ncbi:hypothetical protein GGG16DRAFT_99875 [Schizophyllum commune]
MEIQRDRNKFDFSPVFLRPPGDVPVSSHHGSLLHTWQKRPPCPAALPSATPRAASASRQGKGGRLFWPVIPPSLCAFIGHTCVPFSLCDRDDVLCEGLCLSPPRAHDTYGDQHAENASSAAALPSLKTGDAKNRDRSRAMQGTFDDVQQRHFFHGPEPPEARACSLGRKKRSPLHLTFPFAQVPRLFSEGETPLGLVDLEPPKACARHLGEGYGRGGEPLTPSRHVCATRPLRRRRVLIGDLSTGLRGISTSLRAKEKLYTYKRDTGPAPDPHRVRRRAQRSDYEMRARDTREA